MQHPDYKRPLQFRTVHNLIPPTPNLEEIKRTNMKIKAQKDAQHQIQILTPRSTRNLNSDADKKKSFRNLSLVLDSDLYSNPNQQDNKTQISNELRENSQNNSNQQAFSAGMMYKGKQNVAVGQFNLNMKKKSKQNTNIEFKEVKASKQKRLSEQIEQKQLLKQKNITKHNNQQESKQLSQRVLESKRSQNGSHSAKGIPYANEFESSTYQNHYKASTLAMYNESLNGFSLQLSNVEQQLHSELVLKEQYYSESVKQINEEFSVILVKLNKMQQQATAEIAECMQRMKAEFKANVRLLSDMRKSIMRYQADISLHYEDIVRELEFTSFEDIMSKYQAKLEYFQGEVNCILQQKPHHPTCLLPLKKMFKYFDRIDLTEMNSARNQILDNEGQFRITRDHLILNENISTKRREK